MSDSDSPPNSPIPAASKETHEGMRPEQVMSPHYGKPPGPMDESSGDSANDLVRTLKLLWRHKILILSLLAVGALAGFLLSQRATPVYQSQMRLKIIYQEPTQIDSWNPGPSDNAYQRFFETILQEATSRNVLMRATDKILSRQDVPSLHGASRDAILEYLDKGAAVAPVQRTNHVAYLFNTVHPDEAPQVLQYLVDAFREETRNNENLGYTQTYENVYKDVAEREKEYKLDREAYVKFQSANNIDDPDVAKLRYSQQAQDIRLRLTRSVDEVIQKQKMLSIVDGESDMDVLNWMKAQSGNWILQNLQQEYDRLNRKKSELQVIYSDEHPDIVQVNDEIRKKYEEMVRVARTRYQLERQDLEAALAVQAQLEKEKTSLEAEIAVQGPILDQAKRLKESADVAKANWERVMADRAQIGSATFRRFTTITPVDTPSTGEKVYPRYSVFIGGGALLGIVIACVIVLLWSRIDDTLKTSVQVPRELGVPTLGTILFSPAIGPDPSGLPLITRMPRSPEAEAIFIVWANIANRLNFQPGQCKVLMFTSSIPEEGKSTTSVNIASVAAQQNLRVLLIDMDLRRPSLHNYFGITNAVGCTQALNRQMRREQCIQRTAVKNLDIMTTGIGDDHPNELVSPANLMGLIAWARANYDLVVLDTPPLLLAADGLIVSRFVDGSVLLIHGGQTSLDTVIRSRDMLVGANANLLGAVLNDRTGAADDRDRAYYYKYSAYYHPAVNE